MIDPDSYQDRRNAFECEAIRLRERGRKRFWVIFTVLLLIGTALLMKLK